MSCCRSSAGRLFHSGGPATPKLLSPRFDCVRGTVHVWTSADRRCRRPTSVELAVVGWVRQGEEVERLVHEHHDFKVDSLPHRQPVKLPQHRREVILCGSVNENWEDMGNVIELARYEQLAKRTVCRSQFVAVQRKCHFYELKAIWPKFGHVRTKITA